MYEFARSISKHVMAVYIKPPDFIPAYWWQALLFTRRHRGYQRVIIDVPYHSRR